MPEVEVPARPSYIWSPPCQSQAGNQASSLFYSVRSLSKLSYTHCQELFMDQWFHSTWPSKVMVLMCLSFEYIRLQVHNEYLEPLGTFWTPCKSRYLLDTLDLQVPFEYLESFCTFVILQTFRYRLITLDQFVYFGYIGPSGTFWLFWTYLDFLNKFSLIPRTLCFLDLSGD